ncbi:cysteine dioxygenase [Ferrimonas pelagia]|uniref:Cysteine dioxygenase n=1 Tax=Ferrimonas pelagia TaxID=1177826 RepID=A0ABP9EWP5_9GAMM
MTRKGELPDKLQQCVFGLEQLLAQLDASDHRAALKAAAPLLAQLTAEDDWLPLRYAQADPDRYQQYLLYLDPLQRFCIVSFVWGPGQSTPIHDHTVWGLISVLRGAERCQRFRPDPGSDRLQGQDSYLLIPGDVDCVSPSPCVSCGDIHQVSNALADGVSVSIHIYGGDIGTITRNCYQDGRCQPFVSGYSNEDLS